MTLVIAVKGHDGIVISGDGKATGPDENDVQSLHTEKVFHLKNGIFWGAAANYIAPDELKKVQRILKGHITFRLPYTLQSVSKQIARELKLYFNGEEMPDDFNLNVIVAGYAQDKKHRTHTPEIRWITSDSGYEVSEAKNEAIIGDTDGMVEVLLAAPRNVGELVNYTLSAIREKEKTCKRVGGDIITGIIREDGWKKTLQATNQESVAARSKRTGQTATLLKL